MKKKRKVFKQLDNHFCPKKCCFNIIKPLFSVI